MKHYGAPTSRRHSTGARTPSSAEFQALRPLLLCPRITRMKTGEWGQGNPILHSSVPIPLSIRLGRPEVTPCSTLRARGSVALRCRQNVCGAPTSRRHSKAAHSRALGECSYVRLTSDFLPLTSQARHALASAATNVGRSLPFQRRVSGGGGRSLTRQLSRKTALGVWTLDVERRRGERVCVVRFFKLPCDANGSPSPDEFYQGPRGCDVDLLHGVLTSDGGSDQV